MKILITGNLGYMGPLVLEHLRDEIPGVRLLGFDSGYYGSSVVGGVLPDRLLEIQYYGDVRKFPGEILKNVDAIIHLAAISNDPIGNTYQEVTRDINFRSTIEIASKAKNAGVKSFVFSSSCSIYGAAQDEARKEDSPLNPLTAYARSKVDSEIGLQKLSGDGFTVTSLRFSTACGFSQRLRLDLVLNDFVACAMTSGHITVLSDGTPWRPLINVKDMARAIEWAVSRKPEEGGSFLAVNVGSDEWNYQVRDLAETVSRMVRGTRVSINSDAPPDKRSYKVDFGLYKELAPHHQPQIDLEKTIKDLKGGLRAIEFKNQNFRASRFMRLVQLKELQEKGLLNEKLEWI